MGTHEHKQLNIKVWGSKLNAEESRADVIEQSDCELLIWSVLSGFKWRQITKTNCVWASMQVALGSWNYVKLSALQVRSFSSLNVSPLCK